MEPHTIRHRIATTSYITVEGRNDYRKLFKRTTNTYFMSVIILHRVQDNGSQEAIVESGEGGGFGRDSYLHSSVI